MIAYRIQLSPDHIQCPFYLTVSLSELSRLILRSDELLVEPTVFGRQCLHLIRTSRVKIAWSGEDNFLWSNGAGTSSTARYGQTSVAYRLAKRLVLFPPFVQVRDRFEI